MARRPMTPVQMTPADLLDRVIPVLRATRIDYAIGGALAMRPHYVRETKDVDIFFSGDDQNLVLRRLRRHFTIVTLAAPYHFAIFPDRDDLDVRIDLMFAFSDPELSAVEEPDSVSMFGRTVRVFPTNILMASKLISDRERDHQDVREMYARGLFAPNEVLRLLRHMREQEAIDRLSVITKASRTRGRR